ncbi:MAG: KH domain-containing protein [Chthonomonadales bacterium]|nr:KH domain-containing protein [Chthonomonadales bacterium]
MSQDSVARTLQYLAEGLVDDPAAVSVSCLDDRGTTVYDVHVADDDVGKVIGRQGRVAAAMRLVARAVAMKSHRKIQVEFGP